jgi:aspartyl-tRNA(Asn)/glutamyl-tRNA(Gln) amidotransferase subunit B
VSAATANAAARGWETVIGLEVHVQLLTRTKMFCACSSAFGNPPNTNVCPVCLALPGALPVPNAHALRLAVRAAYGLGLTVHPRSRFARKNYFYPDLPKGYQITQHSEPLSTGGRLEFTSPERGTVRAGIARIHVEEDAGKSFHDKVPGMTAVDFNRSGVPLIEIVGEPDLRSPAEARGYLTALKQVLLYLEVSDCSMEEGSLRVDANVSVRPAGSAELRTRCEIKNLNSFSNVERALAAERDRQIAAYERGGTIEQRTMTFDAVRGEVRPTRSKEESHDYRYFPEPDLPPLVLDAAWLAEVRASLPELPAAKRARFETQYGLTRYEVGVLTAEREQADLYEMAVAKGGSPKSVATWMMNEVDRLRAVFRRVSAPEIAKLTRVSSAEVFVTAVAAVSQSVEKGDLNRQAGRQLLEEIAAKPERLVESLSAGAPRAIAASLAQPLGILQVSDSGEIEGWVRDVLAAHAAEAARWRGGEKKLFGFLVGQVMKRSKGRADPKQVNAALRQALAA